MEIYKPIKDFEDTFHVSNFGNVKSIKTNVLRKPRISPNGYKTLYLKTKNKTKNLTLHSIIANAFIEKPISNYKLIVDHIDGNKLNNNINNLRWASYSENVKNSYITNLNYQNIKKAVYKINKDNNNIIEKYNSIKEACVKNNNISYCGIIQCCKNKQITSAGYKWKYVENTKNILDEQLYENDEQFILIDNIYDDKFVNYAISNYGKIINIQKNIIMKITSSSSYSKICLSNIDKKSKDYLVHRLVAYFFINKFDNSKIINHLDENKLNNYYKNLEILNNCKENSQYSCGKKIIQYDKITNEIINIYPSIKDAARKLNLDCSKISRYVNNISKSCSGYILKFE